MADQREFSIGQPDLSEALMRGLALKGDLPQTLEAVFAPLILSEDFTRPEFQRLRRMARLTGGRRVAGVAGQLAYVALRPRNADRSICVVERVLVNNPNAGVQDIEVAISSGQIVLAAVTSANIADDRLAQVSPGGSVINAQFGVASATNALAAIPAAAGAVMQFQLPGNGGTLVLDFPFVLTGNPDDLGNQQALIVGSLSAAASLTVNFCWRERQPLFSELG